MTDIVTPPTIDAMPAAPQPTDTPEAFSAKAFATAAAQTQMVTQTNASAAATQQNATAANERAVTAQQARTDSLQALEDAVEAASAAAAQAAIAVAAAQAALAGAGIPAPSPNRVYATDGSSAPAWRDLASMAALQGKADKDGAVVTRMTSPWVDLGNIAANGTATVNVQAGSVQRFAALGNYTVAFSNLPAGVVALSLRLRCEGLAGRTGSWPAVGPNGGWRKADGSLAATPSAAGIVFKTGAPDFIFVMIDNGSIVFVVMQ